MSSGLMDLLRIQRDAAQGNTAVCQRQAIRTGNHQNIGAVFFMLVVDITCHGFRKSDHRHHRSDTGHQSRQNKGGPGLSAQQIFNCNFL